MGPAFFVFELRAEFIDQIIKVGVFCNIKLHCNVLKQVQYGP